MKSSKLFLRISYGLVFFLFVFTCAHLALAAYERISPGEAITLGEFVYDDDFVATTSPCTIAIHNPSNVLVTSTDMIASTSGWHYYTFSGSDIQGTWPTVMTCGATSTGDLARLDKTFVVGYVNASTSAISAGVWNDTSRSLTDYATSSIASAVWNATGRTLSNFGSLVSQVATAVWGWTDGLRSLTSRQIGAGEYIAGVSSQYLVTQVASQEQASSTKVSVDEIKDNVTAMLLEMGSGTISAIKTNTDTIKWSDITGIMTSTSQIKAKTDTIDWSNVTALMTSTSLIHAKTNTINWSDVTGIMTSTSLIQAKTDTINWLDITGLMTSTSLIQAKTNAINWDNVTGIKTNTDTINWSDVANIMASTTAIKAKTDTINWIDVTALNTSQAEGWTVTLSDFGETMASKVYRAKLQILDPRTVPTDATSTPTLTIYDPNRTEQVLNGSMIKDSDGTYHYNYSIPSDALAGVWETEVSVVVDAGKTVKVNDYWEVTGPPPHVSVNDVTDVSIPDVSANITIVNEGLNWYEYHYEWCVVSDVNNACGGNDDIFYGTASERIELKESFDTNLIAKNLPSAGNYYFKVMVYYGTEKSGASMSFVATQNTTPPVVTPPSGGSPGGGGGPSSPSVPEVVTTCNGADFNHDTKVNSVDFSILLAFWKTVWPFKNSCVDINSDKQVNSVDFSILMYQWGTKK